MMPCCGRFSMAHLGVEGKAAADLQLSQVVASAQRAISLGGFSHFDIPLAGHRRRPPHRQQHRI